MGDEFQSIYGFRHADVAVFRERREQSAQRLPLSQNYRSRPEVLAAVNHLFGDEFGTATSRSPRRASSPIPCSGTRSSCSSPTRRVTSRRARSGATARRELIARRVRELVDAGAAEPGEIVLLFAAGTDAERYERALAREGPADLPRDRPRVLRPAAGRRPARILAPAAQPLRRRGAARRCWRRRSSA